MGLSNRGTNKRGGHSSRSSSNNRLTSYRSSRNRISSHSSSSLRMRILSLRFVQELDGLGNDLSGITLHHDRIAGTINNNLAILLAICGLR